MFEITPLNRVLQFVDWWTEQVPIFGEVFDCCILDGHVKFSCVHNHHLTRLRNYRDSIRILINHLIAHLKPIQSKQIIWDRYFLISLVRKRRKLDWLWKSYLDSQLALGEKWHGQSGSDTINWAISTSFCWNVFKIAWRTWIIALVAQKVIGWSTFSTRRWVPIT